MSAAQCTVTSTLPNVTTWHNDNCRTGWQPYEPYLTAQPNQPGSVNQSNFGLLWRWGQTAGRVYAQPLAVNITQKEGDCTNPPCNWIIVADEEDMLYAFNSAPSANCPTCTPMVWSLNLAQQVNQNYTYVNCTISNEQTNFAACVGGDPDTGEPGPFSTTNIGVTGTPVIDMSANPPILYVVGAVCAGCQNPGYNQATGYYLFAVDIFHKTMTSTEINGSVQGQAPGKDCHSTYNNGSGTIPFSSTPPLPNSSNPSQTGIVWAVEQHQNSDNTYPQAQGTSQDCYGTKGPSALHAFCAAAIPGTGSPCPNVMTELYNSRAVATSIDVAFGFPTPTVYNGQVFVGTQDWVAVFGLCNTNQGWNNKCQP